MIGIGWIHQGIINLCSHHAVYTLFYCFPELVAVGIQVGIFFSHSLTGVFVGIIVFSHPASYATILLLTPGLL